MEELQVQMVLPDLWQQEAIRALQAGRDVVVDAPTGAGKTYIFELLVETGGLKGQAIYTVPTRALANDKLLEWRRRGWNTGIITGDIAENLNAPVVVATLETQKHRFVRGEGPALLVVDEYQMLGDETRGVNYELSIALAPAETQLLLLSGSVGNPGHVAQWLRRIGRNTALVQHADRPVPLDEVALENLPDTIPSGVKGFWPRLVARALKAGMGPLLAFAPRRKSAEGLARQLASALPEEDPLDLTAQQKRLAGETLSRLLRGRIAFHHSGLDYRQRAGLIEPLAKAGQLRVVVATMGLAAGINFSLRSVLVTDREYRAADRYHLVRPDELLQMFGRAGRRGLDKKGYILVAPGKPRLHEARPLTLKRTERVDWPTMIEVMHQACRENDKPREAARRVAERLYSPDHIPLGFKAFQPESRPASETEMKEQSFVEMLNFLDAWERRRAPVPQPLETVWIRANDRWIPALSSPSLVGRLGEGAGALCQVGAIGSAPRYGRIVHLARIGTRPDEGELVLNRWLIRRLRKLEGAFRRVQRSGWTLERLEEKILPVLPRITGGGASAGIEEKKGMISARLDYGQAQVYARIDSEGQALFDPPRRRTRTRFELSFKSDGEELAARGGVQATPAEAWFQLGLIDDRLHPTRRGVIFSFFNHGEGLAIAAALEESSYPISELVFDLANLRAGHRFEIHESYSGRLGATCRARFRGLTYHGYLFKGVPPQYGDGAAELLAEWNVNPAERRNLLGEELLSGDVERAALEWRSLLMHIANAPDYPWNRWQELRARSAQLLDGLPPRREWDDFPPLTAEQNRRHKSFLRFD